MNRPKQYVKEIPGYFYSEEDDYLGEGKFGKVYRCTHKETGNIFAAKKIERRLIRGSNESNAFQEEKEILNNIDHPNIIKAHDYQYTKNSHYLIIDYCNGGTLRDKMEKKNIQGRITPIPIPEGTAIPYLMQILNGIYYLHVKKGIMHRDIKPENILLHQGNIVITDLGSAKRYEGYSETYVGTEIYQAPELLELNFGDGRNANYDYRVDLWSIGVVYYEMLYARLPFIANTNIELRKMINSKCGKNLVMNPNIKISDESQDLLRGLLSLVKERFEWKDIFQHKLFKNFKAGSLKRSMPKDFELTLKMFTENEENDLPMPNTEWSFSNRNQSLRDSEHQSEPLDQTLQHFEMPVDPPESHVINSNMPIKFSVDSISVHNSNNRNKPNPKMDVVGNSDPMIRPDSMKKKELPQRLVSNSSPTSVVQSATIIPHLETSNFELYRVHIISDIKWLSKFLSLSQSVCENIYERIKESKLNNNLLIDAVVSLLDKPLLNCGNYLKRLDWDEKSKSDNDINDQKHHLVNKKKEALNLRTQIQNYLNENNKKKSLYQSSFIQCPGTTKRLIKLISAKEEELNQNDDKQKRRDINLIFNLVIMAFYDLEHRKEIEMSREIHLHMADKIYRLYRDTTYINDRAIKIIEEILYLSAKTN